ncbi:MAG: methyltransferase domain-containing protein [Paracoccaceae bacterium]
MTDYARRRTVMVDTQVRPSDVTKFPIIEAMLSVPREHYVPSHLREAAYAGETLNIGEGRVLLDARTMAKMLDFLNIRSDEMVLDLGCGLGYSAAIIARIAEAVVAVESDEAMAGEAQATLSADNVDNAAVVTAPLTEGAPRHGPYDVITVQGGVEALPDSLAAQLKEGGRIGCIFMDGSLGTCRIGLKRDGVIAWRDAFNAGAPVLAGFEHERAFAL